MKKFNKITLAIVSIVIPLLFASCEEEIVRDPSPVQSSGIQAFIYESTPQNMVFLPANNQSFDILIGRKNTTDAVTINLSVSNPDNVFVIPTTASFDAGEAVDTLKVTFSMDLGTSSKLTIVLDEEDTFWYGRDSITISVSRDYTWESAGVVSMTSSWAGAIEDVEIQAAKESPGLYRLVSPYNVLEPDYCPEPGYHLQFVLDPVTYNAVSVPNRQLIGETYDDEGVTYDIEFFHADFGDTFTNEGNVYTIKGSFFFVTPGGAGVFDQMDEVFEWKEGYPLDEEKE
ncbi:MAG: hypothetical protein PHQ11_14120 [Paludibacter sp.]|nr:hypothetical protein [Paludibacter sp.]MDD4198374.1 hypothetical protein [Paludibacter sp.]MDD4428349.1 hypothetical protein [Paludibacter sp.]